MKLDIEKILGKMEVPEQQIGLPTSGASISKVEYVKAEDTFGRTDNFYRVTGEIHAVDKNAPDICFQAGFPENWNGRLLHYGGGGIDGILFPVEMPCVGRSKTAKTPLTQGYIVFNSDSGHQALPENYWDCRWALNDESLENFAHAALKKVRDVVCYLAERYYGAKPLYVYFAGGSNGGRECMKAIQNYPEDYDGAICFYPVLYWVLKVLMDHRNGNALSDSGEEAWISAETYRKVMQVIMDEYDQLDGACDQVISNVAAAVKKKEAILPKLEKVLNVKQIQMMEQFAQPLQLPFSLGYGKVTLPGYAVFEGAPLVDFAVNMFGTSAKARDVGSVVGADNLISCQIVREYGYPASDFKPEKRQEELLKASKMLDAYNTDLVEFSRKGGKIILVQGTTDSLVTMYGTIQYYEALKERFGKEELDKFLKFYLVPGYGHGMGEMFTINIDLVTILDNWAAKGIEPMNLVAEDSNDTVNKRTRPIYEYPYYPEYSGEGDVNSAENFHPAELKW